MRVDLTVGSGGPYGGATVSVEHAAPRLRVEHVRVPAGAREVPLPDMGAGESLIGGLLGPIRLVPIAAR